VNKRFNLLPHRQMMRRRTQLVLARQVAVTAMLGVALSGLAAGLIDLQNEYEEGYNKTLNERIIRDHSSYKRATELIARRDSLTDKKRILERVDARRTTSVLIMNDLLKSRPDGLYLTRLIENGDSLIIEGLALTSDAVATMFERMTRSENIDDLVLEEVQWVEQTMNAFAFSMRGRVRLVGLETPETGLD
jgi:type IV pilus assembly protein PilN